MIDVTDYFSFEGQYTGGSAYWRAQELVILKGDTYKLRAVRLNGSSRQTFTPGEEFTLLCDGKPLVTATGEGQWLAFVFPATLLAEGWHVFDIEGHSCMVIGAYVLKGDQAQPHDWLPVWTASNEFSRKDGLYHLKWVPARFEPVQAPLPAWDFVPFSEPVSKRDTIRRDLVPVRKWTPTARTRTVTAYGRLRTGSGTPTMTLIACCRVIHCWMARVVSATHMGCLTFGLDERHSSGTSPAHHWVEMYIFVMAGACAA